MHRSYLILFGMVFMSDVGIVHTSNGPKADNPWLCVDLGEEAIVYSAGFYAVHGSNLYFTVVDRL